MYSHLPHCRGKSPETLAISQAELLLSTFPYMWYPIAVHCRIAVHGLIRGPKDLYRAVDRYCGRSYRSKTLKFRFAVAVTPPPPPPLVVHGPIMVQLEFFQFPERNVRIDISLSTDFRAFSRARKCLARTLWWKLQPYCCQGFGWAEPAISVATPPLHSTPSAVGLAPSARQ